MQIQGVMCALCAVGLVLRAGSGAVAGAHVTHNESGDAGDGVGGAAQIAGTNPGDVLGVINGATDSASQDFVDAYRIQITDPGAFFATTDGSSFDTMLYLFDTAGNGLLANDDTSGVVFQSTLVGASDDGTGISVGLGTYILAVTGFQMDPVDLLGQAIFDIPIGSLTEVSGPDGAGGGSPLSAWQDNTVLGGAATGSYSITLRGVGVVPTPGVVGIAGAAGLSMGMRRRRRA
jgi:hypothetical protein